MRGTKYLEPEICQAYANARKFKMHQENLQKINSQNRNPFRQHGKHLSIQQASDQLRKLSSTDFEIGNSSSSKNQMGYSQNQIMLSQPSIQESLRLYNQSSRNQVSCNAQSNENRQIRKKQNKQIYNFQFSRIDTLNSQLNNFGNGGHSKIGSFSPSQSFKSYHQQNEQQQSQNFTKSPIVADHSNQIDSTIQIDKSSNYLQNVKLIPNKNRYRQAKAAKRTEKQMAQTLRPFSLKKPMCRLNSGSQSKIALTQRSQESKISIKDASGDNLRDQLNQNSANKVEVAQVQSIGLKSPSYLIECQRNQLKAKNLSSQRSKLLQKQALLTEAPFSQNQQIINSLIRAQEYKEQEKNNRIQFENVRILKKLQRIEQGKQLSVGHHIVREQGSRKRTLQYEKNKRDNQKIITDNHKILNAINNAKPMVPVTSDKKHGQQQQQYLKNISKKNRVSYSQLIRKRIEMVELEQSVLPSINQQASKSPLNSKLGLSDEMRSISVVENQGTCEIQFIPPHQGTPAIDMSQSVFPKSKTKGVVSGRNWFAKRKIKLNSIDRSSMQLQCIFDKTIFHEQKYFMDIQQLKNKYAAIFKSRILSQSPENNMYINDAQNDSIFDLPNHLSPQVSLHQDQQFDFQENANNYSRFLDQIPIQSDCVRKSTELSGRKIETMELASYIPRQQNKTIPIECSTPHQFQVNLPQIGPMRNYNIYINPLRSPRKNKKLTPPKVLKMKLRKKGQNQEQKEQVPEKIQTAVEPASPENKLSQNLNTQSEVSQKTFENDRQIRTMQNAQFNGDVNKKPVTESNSYSRPRSQGRRKDKYDDLITNPTNSDEMLISHTEVPPIENTSTKLVIKQGDKNYSNNSYNQIETVKRDISQNVHHQVSKNTASFQKKLNASRTNSLSKEMTESIKFSEKIQQNGMPVRLTTENNSSIASKIDDSNQIAETKQELVTAQQKQQLPQNELRESNYTNVILKEDADSFINEVNVTTVNTTSNNLHYRVDNSTIFNNGNGIKDLMTSQEQTRYTRDNLTNYENATFENSFQKKHEVMSIEQQQSLFTPDKMIMRNPLEEADDVLTANHDLNQVNVKECALDVVNQKNITNQSEDCQRDTHISKGFTVSLQNQILFVETDQDAALSNFENSIPQNNATKPQQQFKEQKDLPVTCKQQTNQERGMMRINGDDDDDDDDEQCSQNYKDQFLENQHILQEQDLFNCNKNARDSFDSRVVEGSHQVQGAERMAESSSDANNLGYEPPVLDATTEQLQILENSMENWDGSTGGGGGGGVDKD